MADLSCQIIIGRVEIWTTALGERFFSGTGDLSGLSIIDWASEGIHPLHGALYSGHDHAARALLLAGSPIDDACYPIAMDHCPAFLDALPPRPDLIAALAASRAWVAFHRALLDEDLPSVRELLHDRTFPINQGLLLTHGLGELRPLQIALLRANGALISALLAAGAEVNALSAAGKSPLREIMENRLLRGSQRRAATRMLSSRGAVMIPPPSWRERLAVSMGIAI